VGIKWIDLLWVVDVCAMSSFDEDHMCVMTGIVSVWMVSIVVSVIASACLPWRQ